MQTLDPHTLRWRAAALLAKGPRHALALARWYAGQRLQRMLGTWSPSATGERAFMAQLDRPVQSPQAIAQHFRSRTRPLFCFDPHDWRACVAAVDAAAKARTIDAADRVCERVFCFRGQPPVRFDGPVDWLHCPQGNRDWTWELNRHAYFVALGRAYAYTGDERYARAFCDLLLDWLERNPVGAGAPNWDSVLEVAYRANAWLWAYHYFLPSPTFDDDALLACLRGLWLHGRYLAANLEQHVPNNHLWLESKALAVLGLLLPELREARAWLGRGLAVLWQQVRRQVWPDGVHAEQAPMYQRIVASELLELLVLLKANRLSAPPEVLDTFARMLDFERSLTKPDGEIPLIGDSALEDSYVRFSALAGGAALLWRDRLAPGRLPWPLNESTHWLLAPERAERLNVRPFDRFSSSLSLGTGRRAGAGTQAPLTSRSFPAGGYYVMRRGEDTGEDPEAAYLVFDAGPFGYPPAPGHGHADALSFELYAGGRTLLTDAGIYSYHLGAAWRNYFRGTAAHNTVRVDGADQSLLPDPWRVLRPARVTAHAWVTTPLLDFVDASHDGYTRLRQPVVHRRQIGFAKAVRPAYWIVLDWLEGPDGLNGLNGQGEHRFDLLFHLLPGAQVRPDPGSGAVRVDYPGGAGLSVCPISDGVPHVEVIEGSLDPIQGWVSRRSGEKQAAPVLRYTRVAAVPLRLGTLLLPHAPGAAVTGSEPEAVRAVPLPVTDDSGALQVEAAGVQVAAGPWIDHWIVDRRRQPGRKRCGGLVTDAALAYVRCRPDGTPVLAALHGGSELRVDGVALLAGQSGSPSGGQPGTQDRPAVQRQAGSRAETRPQVLDAAPGVAYVSQSFPSLTKTFVYREVLGLRRRGLAVRPISTWRPDAPLLSGEAAGLVDGTFYIFPLRWPALAGLHLRYLITRPARYLSALLWVTLFNREPARNRLRSLLHFAYAVRAAREVERSGAQHVHADFALNSATVGWVAARLTGRPFSFTAHAADIFVNPILLREKIAAARFVTTISEYNRRHLAGLARNGQAADKIHVVHCGLDVQQFVPPEQRESNARPLLLAVGRLVEKKGLRYLVEACHVLAEHGYNFECRIVGQGPQQGLLEQTIRQHNLGSRVSLAGALPQEQVRALLGRADVFALPCVLGSDNDQDGIPVVLMEAMAMGLPVVSTPISGIPELIEDEVSGALVPPGDSAALAQALARLIDSPALRAQWGRAGRARVVRDFNLDQSVERLAQLFGTSNDRRTV